MCERIAVPCQRCRQTRDIRRQVSPTTRRLIAPPEDGSLDYHRRISRKLINRPNCRPSFADSSSPTGKGRTTSRCAQRQRHFKGYPERSFGAWTIAYGPGAPHLHMEKRAGSSHSHRISHPASAGESTWGREKPQRLDGCCLRRPSVCRRPNHR
jgi:hypothetical protein